MNGRMMAFVVGIGGGSGSGKSVIADRLRQLLSPLSVEIINQDRYFRHRDALPRHRSPDSERVWPDYNHPYSFDVHGLRSALQRERGQRADVVIVEGILALHDGELRSLMDLTLFVETDADERIVRRIRRNVAAGHNLDDICDYYLDSVRHRHREFCQPTRRHADLVVPGGEHDRARADELLNEVCERVRAGVTDGRAANGGGSDAGTLAGKGE